MKRNRFMHSEPNSRALVSNADNYHVQKCQHTRNANIVVRTTSGANSTVLRMESYAKNAISRIILHRFAGQVRNPEQSSRRPHDAI